MPANHEDRELREDYDLRDTALQNAASIAEARRKAEHALRASREAHRSDAERLRAIFEQAAVGIAVAELDGRFVEANQRFLQILGYGAAELQQLSVHALTHPDDLADTRRNIERLMSGECSEFVHEKRYLRKDCSVVWSRTAVSLLRDGSGHAHRFIGVIEDITSRKQVEQALHDETRLLETLNRTGAILASKLELQALLQAVTDAGTEISGAQFGAFFYNVADERGKSYMLYTLSGAPREAFERLGQPRATPLFEPTFTGRAVVRCHDVLEDPRYGRWGPHQGMPDGHLPVRSYLAVPVVSRSGEVIGGLFFGHSRPGVFTERVERVLLGIAAQASVAVDNARLFETAHKAAQEREALLESERHARTEAERASAMKDEFLATLSHELRTPLTAILGWAQALRVGKSSEAEMRQGLETIERNARMQTQLIEDLLDMSRITSGKLRLDIQPVDPMQFIEAAIEAVRPAAEAKSIRLQRVLDPGAGPVSGDPSRLQQVVWNLLSNAIKFTPKGGKVQVVLQRVNSQVEIGVTDTGIGIEPQFLPYVFDRFRQADASTTRSVGGLGLGLAIVKQLVDMHGGCVSVASAGPNRGATFTVLLPLAAVHRSSDAVRTHPKGLSYDSFDLRCPDLSGITVLVVDDAEDSRVLVQRLLEECHARVLTAASGAEGLRLIDSVHPDVLVSDIGMPDMDGYQFLRAVRALGPDRGGHLPAVALTAFARLEDRTRALRAGYLAHLAKPIEAAELMATLASIAGRSDDWAQNEQ
jgi:PAS domain S-box-containing protein